MQVTLHRRATLTFAVESYGKEWAFDKVITVALSPEVLLIGRSCTSEAHPFHLHPPGFARIAQSASSELISIPRDGIRLIEEWNNTGRTTIGEKERKLKEAENVLKQWFDGLA